eukprot:GILK01006837.1.p1 GENE.GILK01006837.1~~GILK01006837.1.p1  ORF type:complete len:501 (-),score=73.95 GILK01006837.1:282-1670(-)
MSATQVVQQSLDEIKQKAHLNAFVHVCENALEQAQRSDVRLQSKTSRPLEGIPIAVKDNFCVKDTPTTAASDMLANFIAPYDATVVSRLSSAGAVILGKTNMDEFGMGSHSVHSRVGPVINPCHTSPPYSAGGSSGGSACAVAAGMCLGALGSDTGGSVRQPAAYTGTVGLKPSYGRVSRHGLLAYASSLDCPGVIAKTVQDVAAIYDVIAGVDNMDSTSLPVPLQPIKLQKDTLKGLRVGIPKEYNVEDLPDEIVELWQFGVEQLSLAGAAVVYVSLPTTLQALAAYYILAPAEAASNLARYDGLRYGHRTKRDAVSLHESISMSRGEGFGSEVLRRILVGNFVLSRSAVDAYFKKAQKVRRLVCDDFSRAFQTVDVLLTPTTPSAAPLLADCERMQPLQEYIGDVMTVPASLAGLPAISLPCNRLSSDLPLGLQLIGAHLSESKLLAVAHGLFQRLNRCN